MDVKEHAASDPNTGRNEESNGDDLDGLVAVNDTEDEWHGQAPSENW